MTTSPTEVMPPTDSADTDTAACTALGICAGVMAGNEAGAKAWLVKPFQPVTLLNAVSKLVLP
jgi:DNA-binding response OmpR family regulator